MITFKHWSAIFAGALLLVSSHLPGQSDAQATAPGNPAAINDIQYHLSATSIAPGERLIVEIRLPSSLAKSPIDSEEPELPTVQDDLLTQNPHWQILDKDYRREQDFLIWKYELTSYQLGRLRVPPVEVKLGPHNFSTEAAVVEVVTTRPPQDQQLREDLGAVSPPFPWRRWLKILFGLALFAGIYGLWRRYSDRLLRKLVLPVPVVTVPEENPLDWLRKQLAILKARVEANAEDTGAVDELTLTLREYFARTLHRPVEAWTTREFRSRLGEETTAVELTHLLERCDEFKFTGTTTVSPGQIALPGIQESERILLPCGT